MSCGDTLVDLFSQPESSDGSVTLSGHVGGSPLNVALGLARLGNHSAFLCKNSTDFIGQRILKYLNNNSVDTQWIIPSSLNSTLAMVQRAEDGSANYAFYIDNTADRSLLPDELPSGFPEALKLLHFGSYSTAIEPTSGSLLALARRESAQRLISYDPNIRPSIEPDMQVWRSQFSEFVKVAGFVKASDEDIEHLFGANKGHDEFAADVIAAGAALVAVTRGSDGAHLYSADGRRSLSQAFEVKVVDTVGAGDTFQSASLHYLGTSGCLDGSRLSVAELDLDELVNFAAQAAAITCTRQGADLPTLADIQTFTK
ncbi:MAG: carbohydrate kinase [Granulosicoccus sp.]|nr:carbohydrate kinase [Granulosicoccus sp.]